MPDQRLERLVQAVQAMAGDLELEALLQRIVDAALELAGARYAALGVIDKGQGDGAFLSAFVHAGMTDALVHRIGHLPEGRGILGLLIEHPEPIRLADLTQHEASAGFPEGHPPMGTFLGAPVRVHGQVFGNLYLTEKAGGAEFTDVDQELIEGLAAIAGSAIANTELFAEVQRLSLIEDRERIGRDLHDTVIQRLFATGLSLQAVAKRLGADDPDNQARVLEAVGDLDETIREIRGVIFSLQDPSSSSGLRARAVALCREMASMLGHSPSVRFDGPVDLVTSPGVADQAVRVLREGLTNVARHASANSVGVTISAAATWLEVRVVDDGIGMPEHRRDGALGLVNLEKRAHDLGGTFGIESSAEGTTLRWHVPL